MTSTNYMNDDRISGAPWFGLAKETTVIVGGAGGISSWLSLFLTRAGVNVFVYDFDYVSKVNLAGQFYTSHFIGMAKTEALAFEINRFSDRNRFRSIKSMYESGHTTPMMFSGFDNMEARSTMFRAWKAKRTIFDPHAENPENSLFIDGRLLAEQLQIFCVHGNSREQIDEYENNHLFNDSEVEDAACTFKQTSHVAAMIAGLMTGFLTNHLTNLVFGADIGEVPFYHEYLLQVNRTTSHNFPEVELEEQKHQDAVENVLKFAEEISTTLPQDDAQRVPEPVETASSSFSSPVPVDLANEYQRFSTNYHQS